MDKLFIVTSYDLGEPVVRNRLLPYIGGALQEGLAVELLSPAGDEVLEFGEYDFHHRLVNSKVSGGRNFFIRAFREWRMARKLLSSIPDDCESGVLITIPSMFLLFSFKGVSGRRYFLDVRDLTWEYLSREKIVTRWVRRLCKYLAKKRVKKFEVVTVTSHTEKLYFNNVFGMGPEKVIMVANGISQKQFDQLEPQEERLAKNDGALRVAYIGNVGVAQNLQTLLEAARRLPQVCFDIVGKGTDFERIRKIRDDFGLSNVNLLGRVPWGQVVDVYLRSDILYAQLSRDFSGAMPSKLYEYLASGRFVIYGGEKQAVEILNDFDSCKIVPPDDPDALVDAFKKVKEQGDYIQVSLANRQRIEREFIREKCVSNFFEKLSLKDGL